ncbi:MAG: hypothetical protein HYX84_04305 [Chloroflexi bacterium]|nr:hypothetical protein [Chloroflexota bacterium]
MADEDIRIGPVEARARVSASKAVILDVVSTGSWERMNRTVAGAIRISPDEINREYRILPPDKEIIAYCT